MAAGGATPKTIAVRDARDGREGAPDLIRASLGLGTDGRLRAALSFGSALDPADLLADSGPPGSACLRLWTVSSPPNTKPDRLVCVTAETGPKLRASVLREDATGQLIRVAPAAVALHDDHILVVRFSQTAMGRPAVVRFAAEATKAGCSRVSCIDVAPDPPKTARLRLRSE